MSGYWGGWTNEQTYQLITMALGIRTTFAQIKTAIPFTAESAQKMCDEVFQMPDSMMENVVWQEVADHWNKFREENYVPK